MMDQSNRNTGQPDLDVRHRTMLILWFAMLMSHVMFLAITFVVERPVSDDNMMLGWIFLAVSLSCFGLSFVLRKQLQSRAAADPSLTNFQSALIVALALCETCSLFGLVLYFATGLRFYYLFFILGVVGHLLHFPRREQLQAASFKKQF